MSDRCLHSASAPTHDRPYRILINLARPLIASLAFIASSLSISKLFRRPSQTSVDVVRPHPGSRETSWGGAREVSHRLKTRLDGSSTAIWPSGCDDRPARKRDRFPGRREGPSTECSLDSVRPGPSQARHKRAALPPRHSDHAKLQRAGQIISRLDSRSPKKVGLEPPRARI